MITDVWFYAAAVPAVLIAGVSKGGFGGGLGVIAVPLMALFIPPVQAAAIMLPILILMDFLGLWAYRDGWDRSALALIVPAACIGIAVGTFTFELLDAASIRLIIGVIAIWFSGHYFARKIWGGTQPEPSSASLAKGGFWGAVAGFTSFVAHAGGPPINVYLLPLRLDKTVYQATTVVFFTAVNLVKLPPYAWLGQLSAENLTSSLILAPLAPIGLFLGVWLHKRVSDAFFYGACYLFVFFTGFKLIWDGLAAL